MTQSNEGPEYEQLEDQTDQSDPWGLRALSERTQGLPEKQRDTPPDPWGVKDAAHLPEPGIEGEGAYDDEELPEAHEEAAPAPVDAWEEIARSRELASAGVFTPKLGSAAATLANLR